MSRRSFVAAIAAIVSAFGCGPLVKCECPPPQTPPAPRQQGYAPPEFVPGPIKAVNVERHPDDSFWIDGRLCGWFSDDEIRWVDQATCEWAFSRPHVVEYPYA